MIRRIDLRHLLPIGMEHTAKRPMRLPVNSVVTRTGRILAEYIFTEGPPTSYLAMNSAGKRLVRTAGATRVVECVIDCHSPGL